MLGFINNTLVQTSNGFKNIEDVVVGDYVLNENNEFKKVVNVEMMKSVESLYIEDNDVTGFIKNYGDKRHQFIAILPDKSTNVFLYLKGLTAEKIEKLLDTVQQEDINVMMPKFTGVKVQNMKNVYSRMGLSGLFIDMADYTGIMKSGANIALGLVVQKAKVEIGKTGGKGAGISTISSVSKIKAAERSVILNRPFIYMIYDSYQCMPIFAGVQQIM